MASVRLTGIEKRYRDVSAVERLDLVVDDRSFVTLLGPSGCGKSTTLRMIAGLEVPTAGDVFFDNENVTLLPANHRDIAMVFQSYALYPHMTVSENIAFPLKNARLSREEIRRRIDSVSQTLGIAELLQRKPRELSGGQRQRVALGRAIVRQPAVYLLDEPLSNLDAQLRLQMRTELKRLHLDLQGTFIYVTHDQSEALTMSDRIAILDRGRLQQFATPAEIYSRPSNVFVAGFIGSPPMNLVPGRVIEQNGMVVFESKGIAASLGTACIDKLHGRVDNVILGIRPEAIRVTPNGSGGIGCTVYMEEVSGADALVTLSVWGTFLRARTNASFRPRTGSSVNIHFEPADAYLFDAKTGEALSS